MEILGGAFGLVIAFLLLILAIFWLIFPWMVYAKLNGLIAGLKKLEDSQSTLQHILTKIAGHAEAVERNSSTAGATSSTSQVTYYYSSDGQQQGPLSAADLKAMRKDGLVTDDTPVLRAGEQQWKVYRDFLALTR